MGCYENILKRREVRGRGGGVFYFKLKWSETEVNIKEEKPKKVGLSIPLEAIAVDRAFNAKVQLRVS